MRLLRSFYLRRKVRTALGMEEPAARWCPLRCPEEAAVGEGPAATSQALAQCALGTLGCFGATSRKKLSE